MIPVVEAIEFNGFMEGGSTYPWNITVLLNGQPVPFVVKLYKESHNQQNSTVLKECVASILAQQLELKTPDIALVDFTPSFIDSLPDNARDFLKKCDQRIKFASRLISPPYENYSPALQNAYLKSFDIGSIYAFDNMILNVDRVERKPNIFFKDSKGILIDHELCLVTYSAAMESITYDMPWRYNYSSHLFYPVLKQMSHDEKQHIFETFDEYISKAINFNQLDFLATLLAEYGHETMIYYDIKEYFTILQRNHRKFVQILLRSIQ